MRVWVKGAAAVCAVLCGCSQIFGLEAPQRAIADAPVDVVPRDGDVIVDDVPMDIGPDAPIACPSQYIALMAGATSKYRLGNQNKPWLDAAVDCADDGVNTHLAVLSASTEISTSSLFSGPRWIGLSDKKIEGTFLAVTAEDTMGYPPATGAPWASDEPSAEGIEVDCVYLEQTASNGLQLKAELCTLNREYICECDAYANDPSRYQ